MLYNVILATLYAEVLFRNLIPIDLDESLLVCLLIDFKKMNLRVNKTLNLDLISCNFCVFGHFF